MLLLLPGIAMESGAKPGIGISQISCSGGQITLVWVGPGGGATNRVVWSPSLGLGATQEVVWQGVLTNGTPPWYDVGCTTKVATASLTSGFFRLYGSLPFANVATPQFTSAGGQYLNQLPLGWTGSDHSAIFQLQVSPNAQFNSQINETWPLGTNENVSFASNQALYCRVRAWSYYPENGGQAGGWSAVQTNQGFVSTAPTFTGLPVSVTNTTLVVNWSAIPMSCIYQFQYSSRADFSTNIAETWPLGNLETIWIGQNGWQFLRVRAWSQLPEAGGLATDWSQVGSCYFTVQPSVSTILLHE